MFKLGGWEILLIVAVVLIIFGPKRLPELGRGIGQFFKNFKSSVTGDKDQNASDSSSNQSDKKPS